MLKAGPASTCRSHRTGGWSTVRGIRLIWRIGIDIDGVAKTEADHFMKCPAWAVGSDHARPGPNAGATFTTRRLRSGEGSQTPPRDQNTLKNPRPTQQKAVTGASGDGFRLTENGGVFKLQSQSPCSHVQARSIPLSISSLAKFETLDRHLVCQLSRRKPKTSRSLLRRRNFRLHRRRRTRTLVCHHACAKARRSPSLVRLFLRGRCPGSV